MPYEPLNGVVSGVFRRLEVATNCGERLWIYLSDAGWIRPDALDDCTIVSTTHSRELKQALSASCAFEPEGDRSLWELVPEDDDDGIVE